MSLRFEGDEYLTTEVPGVANGTTSDWGALRKLLDTIMSQPHF
jgi:hypothetical protein